MSYEGYGLIRSSEAERHRRHRSRQRRRRRLLLGKLVGRRRGGARPNLRGRPATQGEARSTEKGGACRRGAIGRAAAEQGGQAEQHLFWRAEVGLKSRSLERGDNDVSSVWQAGTQGGGLSSDAQVVGGRRGGVDVDPGWSAMNYESPFFLRLVDQASQEHDHTRWIIFFVGI